MILVYKEQSTMVPRVFVSSTFYDLKYARERIGSFVENYGFNPIISEKGNIGYIPWQKLDKSCYEAMRSADMALLIIGGRYGSPASDEVDVDDKFNDYKSVTRREFETAVRNGVPIYVFIEDRVFVEYETYKLNKDWIERDLMENQDKSFTFSSVDNINVFRFISEVYASGPISVFSFSKIEDIENTLRNQWASLFQYYLACEKNAHTLKRLESPISQIESSLKKMNILLDKVGEKIIGDSTKELEQVQNQCIIENVAGIIARTFQFCTSLKKLEEIRTFLDFFVSKLYEAKSKDLLDAFFSDDAKDNQQFDEHFAYDNVFITHYKERLVFQYEEIEKSIPLKSELVDRLMQTDYLSKMGLIG